MAAITAKMVADLRTKTGCGMMDCKKALSEANGDMDEAVKILREKGLSVAAKKASRVAAEGIVDIMTSEDGKTVAMIEVNAETDFVAKNATFQAFVRGILSVIIKNRPASIEELNELPYDESFTVEGKRKDMVFTIGENMTIRRFVVVDGITSTYIHGKGTTGVVVKFNTSEEIAGKAEFTEFSKNIALQIAAGNPPTYVSRDNIPESAVEEELNVQIAAAKNDEKLASKPEAVLKKIVEGKMGKLFYERVCLVEQPYVKEDSISVGEYVKRTAKELGGEIEISGFWLYEKGEGLEKREDDFAAEIESLVKGK
ncbi:MAG: translation elongation factor Ts [Firmicutes bacterium]|nr:translation elongation factor Ts [Bacillota bacterium]